jgi:hypothetical protein
MEEVGECWEKQTNCVMRSFIACTGRMRWAGYAARTAEMRSAHKI